jgi:hypothetical protein
MKNQSASVFENSLKYVVELDPDIKFSEIFRTYYEKVAK